MISVMLYKGFAKDTNSTRQPVSGSGAVATPFQCEIFEPCSLLAPVIKIKYSGTDLQGQGYNYAHIPDWGRFYWITDQVFQEGFWYVHLSVDALASWKTAIGSSTQYVLRAASEYNSNIIDDIYAPDAGYRTDEQFPASNPFAQTVTAGAFILGISGGEPNFGALQYVYMTEADLAAFINFLLGQTLYMGDLGDMTDDVARVILNPLQYVQSCKWFPFGSMYTISQRPLKVGWWTTSLNAKPLALGSGATETLTFTIDVPKHPQANTIGRYLLRAPYSQYKIWLPAIGYVDISADMLWDIDEITASYNVDLITGTAIVTLLGNSETITDKIIYATTCDVAVNVPLAQISGAANYISTGLSQLSGGFSLGGVEKLAIGGLGAWLGAGLESASAQGSAGSTAFYRRSPELQLRYVHMCENSPALLGKPLCENKLISTLSGFVMCSRAHIAPTGATRPEMETIENAMNGGFFYE